MNVSQTEFAEIIAVATTTVSRWENGRTVPSKLAQLKLFELCKDDSKQQCNMDSLQLKLCDIQGRLFELSAEKEWASATFIKAFMTSETAKALDSKYNRMQWAGEEYLLEEVVSKGGEKLEKSGEVYLKDVLYWIGYIYRYWHYYTGEASSKIYKKASPATMKRNYLMFHTMAAELAIENLKEIYTLNSTKRGSII